MAQRTHVKSARAFARVRFEHALVRRTERLQRNTWNLVFNSWYSTWNTWNFRGSGFAVRDCGSGWSLLYPGFAGRQGTSLRLHGEFPGFFRLFSPTVDEMKMKPRTHPTNNFSLHLSSIRPGRLHRPQRAREKNSSGYRQCHCCGSH